MKPARITHPNIAQRKRLSTPRNDSRRPSSTKTARTSPTTNPGAAFSSTLEQSPTPETVDLKHQAEAQRDIQTLAECDKISQEHGARWLEMGRLPHWDPTRMRVLDHMHYSLHAQGTMFDALRGLHWDWIQDRDGTFGYTKTTATASAIMFRQNIISPTRPVVADLFFHIMILFSPPQSRDLPAMIMGTPSIWVACRSPVVVICIDTEGVGNFSRPAVKDIHESMVATANDRTTVVSEADLTRAGGGSG
ncbi:hypothetical protein B0H14DRAFT_2627785 [Mycena olivaceomarginata]|nr:hypothetical protein B0H14DRAFT_2627785 [Mycena olivaceomarginata]